MDTLVTYLAIDDKELPFVLYAYMLHMYIAQGPMIPKHTSHEIATRVELALRRIGAQVEGCCPVKRFLSDGKQACGVKLEDGTKIHAKRVICNANQTIALTSMIPEELVPSRMKKLFNVRELTINAFTLALGLDDTPENLGITAYECFVGHVNLDELDKMAHRWEKTEYSASKIQRNLRSPTPRPLKTDTLAAVPTPLAWCTVTAEMVHPFRTDGAQVSGQIAQPLRLN